MGGYSIFVAILGIISLVSGYPDFQDSIPNGKNVPSPCNASETWYGVGHINKGGGGTRNPFGIAFAANNFTWNARICQMDSDGDGDTNGDELGDPDCTWTPGDRPKWTTGISHPGVCEPINSQACAGSPFKCRVPFDCPAIREPDTFSVNVDIPETVVPAQETTYICMNFELPHDQPYHIVATTPRINNTNVMHHLIAYECEVGTVDELNHPLNEVYDCNMSPENSCQRMVGIWAFGSEGDCLNQNAGFLVGGNGGIKYMAYQIHWNNPWKIPNYIDSSGMSFHMTPSLRPYNAGILLVGQEGLEIPPGEEAHVQTGSCAPVCTRKYITDSIYVTAASNHMHYLGRAQITEALRDGEHVNLATDDVFDYNSPVLYDLETPVEIRRGDEIKTTCVFSSLDRNHTTLYGEGTNDEMCYAFLFYYPKEKLSEPTCSQTYDIPSCDFEDDQVNGCDFGRLFDTEDQGMNLHYTKVFEYCRIEMCLKECLNYLRVKRNEPCFKGSAYKLTKLYVQLSTDPATLAGAYQYFLLMDSCNLQLAAERAENQTDSAEIVVPMVPVIILAMGALLLS